jgi:plasmid stabilization system protein ParE
MEERISRKPCKVSRKFKASVDQIYKYGCLEFGTRKAEFYDQKISAAIRELPYSYGSNPYCRHIQIPGEVYRNIIIGSHLIIYRVTDERIEVLDIIHGASGEDKIRATGDIRL